MPKMLRFHPKPVAGAVPLRSEGEEGCGEQGLLCGRSPALGWLCPGLC